MEKKQEIVKILGEREYERDFPLFDGMSCNSSDYLSGSFKDFAPVIRQTLCLMQY